MIERFRRRIYNLFTIVSLETERILMSQTASLFIAVKHYQVGGISFISCCFYFSFIRLPPNIYPFTWFILTLFQVYLFYHLSCRHESKENSYPVFYTETCQTRST